RSISISPTPATATSTSTTARRSKRSGSSAGSAAMPASSSSCTTSAWILRGTSTRRKWGTAGASKSSSRAGRPGRAGGSGRPGGLPRAQRKTKFSAPSANSAVSASSVPSDEVESIEIHDLVPRGDEVPHELVLCVVGGVDLRERTELGVRTEEQIDAGAGPLARVRAATAAIEGLSGVGRRFPLRVHVEQVHEEIVAQCPRPAGEDAEIGRPGVRLQDTQAAHEYGHLRRAQCQHLGSLEQRILGRHLL